MLQKQPKELFTECLVEALEKFLASLGFERVAGNESILVKDLQTANRITARIAPVRFVPAGFANYKTPSHVVPILDALLQAGFKMSQLNGTEIFLSIIIPGRKEFLEIALTFGK